MPLLSLSWGKVVKGGGGRSPGRAAVDGLQEGLATPEDLSQATPTLLYLSAAAAGLERCKC